MMCDSCAVWRDVMKFWVVLMLLALGGVASADELTIKPGMWESTMTTTNSMMPRPMTTTSKNCVTEPTYRPEEMLDNVEHCKNMTSDVSDNTLTFSMQCTMQGADVNVSGRFSSAEDTGDGDMKMDMKMGPGNMTMNMKWTTKRIGDC